jgi:sugar phosphate isomerase/epimerase
MKSLPLILPLLLLIAPSPAADIALMIANTESQKISSNPRREENLQASSKLSRIRVDAENKGFVDSAGKRFTPCGVSYYRPGTGWAPQLWKQFDAEATRRDFQLMRRMGMNVARVFVTYGSFYTQSGELDAKGLAAFDTMLDLADEAGIYLHPTGPEHWEGMPAWTHAVGDVHHDLANEACLKLLEDFWTMFAGRYRHRNTIWAYDLKNEPVVAWDTPASRIKWDAWRISRQQPVVPVPERTAAPSEILGDYQRFREGLAESWIARQTRAIRAADPQALVTVGLIQWSVPAQPISIDQYTGFRPEIIARHLDFMSLHFYPLANGVYRYENQAAEDANLAVVESMARECAKPGKPLVIGEFGWYGGGSLEPGGQPADEEQQARWCRRLVEVTSPMACGWINWGLHDTPEATDVSRLTGLRTVAGEDKVWGRSFGLLVKDLPTARALPVRPDLPWESCTMDGAAMASFQTEYLAAFLARKP